MTAINEPSRVGEFRSPEVVPRRCLRGNFEKRELRVMAMTLESCLNRLKATAISKDKACYVLLLVYWKDVAIGFIRVEAYPDMRVIRVEALTTLPPP